MKKEGIRPISTIELKMARSGRTIFSKTSLQLVCYTYYVKRIALYSKTSQCILKKVTSVKLAGF